MGMEIRQVRGEDLENRFNELYAEANKYVVEDPPAAPKSKTARLFILSVVFLIVTVAAGYVSSRIPVEGFFTGLMPAVVALAAFAVAVVLFVIGLVRRSAKEKR